MSMLKSPVRTKGVWSFRGLGDWAFMKDAALTISLAF